MRVFVTGGTGALGSHVVPALLRQGHTVTALARTPAKAAALTRQGARPACVSIFDRSALMTACDGRPHRGPGCVVDAAFATGVGRVVQESVSMPYHDQGASWIGERQPIDRYPMARANIAAEASANRFSGAGGTAVVLRFGWFYGPGAAHSEQMLALARHHICLILGAPDSYVSSIHLADAAPAIVAALQAPAGTFNITDDKPLTRREYAQTLAAAARKRMWVRGPGRSALLFGDRLTSLTRSLRVCNARFRSVTRWVPRSSSARDGWLAVAAAIETGQSPTAEAGEAA